jgi:hypothetical protein
MENDRSDHRCRTQKEERSEEAHACTGIASAESHPEAMNSAPARGMAEKRARDIVPERLMRVHGGIAMGNFC